MAMDLPTVRISQDFYVGWGTLALINSGLAQSKGRRGLVWFLVSLLLGPLATLLIVVWDPVVRQDQPPPG
jgi:hypothetical protein